MVENSFNQPQKSKLVQPKAVQKVNRDSKVLHQGSIENGSEKKQVWKDRSATVQKDGEECPKRYRQPINCIAFQQLREGLWIQLKYSQTRIVKKVIYHFSLLSIILYKSWRLSISFSPFSVYSIRLTSRSKGKTLPQLTFLILHSLIFLFFDLFLLLTELVLSSLSVGQYIGLSSVW